MSLNDFTVTFASYNLGNIPNVYFSRRYNHEIATRSLNYATLARKHGRKLISSFYTNKKIDVEGYINADDRDAMDVARDSLLIKLQQQEGDLDLTQAGATRRYRATMENIIFTHIERGLMRFTITFQCSSPFGVDVTETLLSLGTTTASTYDFPVTIGGTFSAELVIAIAIPSITDGTNKTVSISNPATGEQISITRTWSNDDSVAIHVRNRQVTVNGSVVEYNGVYPEWQPGSGIVRYTDTFTARTSNLSASYYKRYV